MDEESTEVKLKLFIKTVAVFVFSSALITAALHYPIHALGALVAFFLLVAFVAVYKLFED